MRGKRIQVPVGDEVWQAIDLMAHQQRRSRSNTAAFILESWFSDHPYFLRITRQAHEAQLPLFESEGEKDHDQDAEPAR